MFRPLTVILAGLAIATAAKLGATFFDDPAPQQARADGTDAPLFAAASAAEGDDPAVSLGGDADLPLCEAPEALLASIRDERELLERQKETAAKRTAELDLATETLDVERGRLEDLKSEVENLLARVEAAHTMDVDRLVLLYQNMKPKDAATIMNDLDIEVTVMVLGTMAERDAAPILAALDPVRARAVSQIILERSKLPGDQRLDNLKF
ncbi:MotE family protein [Sagittula salina]|uniref:Uncharacterized protein n=1 Tax=Sagittula salina TaxID=2820268 RepID=A0A940MSI3_9RHOB|nr:hypothetical protein [Sagittula salina]